jgi:2,4-dienoyl-CoA reductase-like NADH-dependent reductase (Old Yellow Enzyme family)
VRAVWPERLPPTIRLGAIDFRPETHPREDSIARTEVLAGRGGDLVDVGMGLNSDEVAVPWNDRGCMVPFAARIRREAGVPVAVSWNLGDPLHADRIIRDGQADLLKIDRPALMNPH